MKQYTQVHREPGAHGVPRVPGSVCKYFSMYIK